MIALVYIFLLSLLIQLYYFLFIFSRLAFKGRSHEKSTDSLPLSIVVCAKNEYNNLINLLPMLLNQKYQSDYEVVIVNDRSTDGTHDLLKNYSAKFSNLKIVTIKDLPNRINAKKYGLTMGIKAARYNRLLFTDADCLPKDVWIQSMISQNNSNAEFILGYSQYFRQPGLLNMFIRFETLYTGIQYLSYTLAGSPYMGVGRNLSYTKNLFLAKNGFNHHLEVTGGDDDLFVNAHATSKNTNIAIGKENMILSDPKRTLRDYFYQKKRHLSVGKHYRFKDKAKLAVLSMSQILFWLSFIASILLTHDLNLILGGFALRTIVLYIVFIRSARILGDTVNWVWLLILEFLYVIYYITTGITAFFAKRITWSSKSNFLPKH